MRVLVTSALVVVMAGSLAAQEKSAPSVPKSGSVANEFQYSPQPLSNYPGMGLNRREMAAPKDDTCFFIRSYIFEREDGNAPVLKGETVCTPSNANAVRHAKRSKVEVIPLTLPR
jgi:hypothetical protein